jgi:hypothetical protein
LRLSTAVRINAALGQRCFATFVVASFISTGLLKVCDKGVVFTTQDSHHSYARG